MIDNASNFTMMLLFIFTASFNLWIVSVFWVFVSPRESREEKIAKGLLISALAYLVISGIFFLISLTMDESRHNTKPENKPTIGAHDV